VDIYRSESGWLLKFDLAGVRLEDVEIEVQGCRVTVRGVRKDWARGEVLRPHRMEILYSRFERTITLPCDIADPEIRLEGRDGILLVHLVEG
jgi:HSP20 family protein